MYNVHVAAKQSLSHNTGATTIRGYCRHFTAQWRERVVHASGHQSREALTRTHTHRESMRAYVNTQMDTISQITSPRIHTSRHAVGFMVKCIKSWVVSMPLGGCSA